MVADVQAACDAFRQVFDASGNGDGTVSLEVAPTLAHDTAGTIAAAERLWARVDRPNAMIKIPGTIEGLPAITHCLAQGINVNVTLLFSVARHREVIAAFSSRVAAARRRRGIRSTTCTAWPRSSSPALMARRTRSSRPRASDAAALLHRVAIANAIAAYAVFDASLSDPAGRPWRVRVPSHSGHFGRGPAPRIRPCRTPTTSRHSSHRTR